MGLKSFLMISSVSLLLLSGCATSPRPELIVQTEYVKQNIALQARPKGVQLSNVKFHVVNKDNIQQFLTQFEKDNGTVTFVAISVKDYEKLSLNVEELKRYILQQGELIVYYENSLK